MSVLIKGGKVVNADQSIYADVYCEDSKIVAIGQNLSVPEDAEQIDASPVLAVGTLTERHD